MVFIYVLELEQRKYYVGKTNNPQFRLDSHFNSNGSAWTKLYTPVKILELIPNCDDYDEDKYTRIYMDKFGINNVRGGSFVLVELEKSTIEHLKLMSNGTNDRCFTCGKGGHFAKDCENTKYLQEFDTIEKIETEIENIINLTKLLSGFVTNKYLCIWENGRPKANTEPLKIEINSELASSIDTNNPTMISAVYSCCSLSKPGLGDIGPMFVNNHRNVGQHENEKELIKLKINATYIERRKIEIKYCESLPPEYAEIFKKNNYENIFELVKDKLLLQIELLHEKLAYLFSKL